LSTQPGLSHTHTHTHTHAAMHMQTAFKSANNFNEKISRSELKTQSE